jgi:hypothetical protein
MTFDQAANALADAGAQEAAETAAASPELGHHATPAEAEQAAVPTPGEDTDLGGATEPFTSPDVEADSFTGSDFNPDLLPDELQPGWKQLQGSYTRKTQELADQRKAMEALGSEEELKTAAEFYRSLQDPDYLKNFYDELGSVVQELGLVEAPVDPEAAEPVAPQLSPELAALAESEPELAPLAQQLTAIQSRIDSFEKQQAEERQALEEERLLMGQAQEIDRMVQVVREEHPDYSDDDWQAIYDRAVAFDGNVLKAAELFEADRNRIIESYIAAKPVPHAVTPTKGGAVVTEDEPVAVHTLDDAQRAAEAYISANDLAEFTG